MTALAAVRLTHEEWQAQVVDYAHIGGWQHLHVRRTIGRGKKWVTATNLIGWPDLFLWHPGRSGVLAAELKVRPDKPTEQQTAVLGSLTAAGIPAYVWYPEDWADVRTRLDEPRRRGVPA